MKFSSRLSSRLSVEKFADLGNESLCSLAIALWGGQTNLLFLAIPMILLLEARQVVKQRWQMSLSDLKEIAKLSGVILAILFVVMIVTQKVLFIYTLLQWLPVAAFPLVMAQTYGIGVQDLLRDEFSNPYLLHLGIRDKRNPVDLHVIYWVLCILAASATDSNHFFFYGAVTGLTALLLWTRRPKPVAPALWLLLFCLSAGLGFAGHMQISQFQQHLETQMIAMLSDLVSGAVNPEGNTTRMGSLGKLKLSNKVVFRVEAPLESANNTTLSPAFLPVFPLLLQEATYNQYQISTWTATNSLFNPVPPGAAEGDWILAPASKQETLITISTNLDRGDGILTLPAGTSTIQHLPVSEMQQNQYGAVQVDATGNAAYAVTFDPSRGDRPADARPTDLDLQVPSADRAAVERTLQTLNLTGKSEREIVNQIAAYFQGFKYSLDLIRPEDETTAVSDFLLHTKAGHCEYFASATALLLRGARIPARYAVGYSVHEFSALERQYIVRSRDAHAWTRFYLDGAWHTLDTTPPDWAAQEKAMDSSFQQASDFVAFLGFQVSVKIRQLSELGSQEVLLLVTPLFGYLIWRSVQRFQGQRATLAGLEGSKTVSLPMQYGLDSELYQIEQQLSAQNLSRFPAESSRQWGQRMQEHLSKSQGLALEKILSLHYRYRFDPNGLNSAERQQLETLSQIWLDQFSNLQPVNRSTQLN